MSLLYVLAKLKHLFSHLLYTASLLILLNSVLNSVLNSYAYKTH